MTTLATVLNAATNIAIQGPVATTPTLGTINSYNASAGAQAVTLPSLSLLNVGATMIVEKHLSDTTANAITFTAYGADTFEDLSTALTISQAFEKHTLQVVQPVNPGTKYWKITQSTRQKTALASGPISVQTVTLNGTPTGGTFSLTVGGQTVTGIAPTATAATVQSGLTGLSSVGSGNATVTGSTGGPYTVTFTGVAANQPITATSSLTPGTASIAISSSPSQFSLTNTTSAGTTVTFTVPPASLTAGAVFRVTLNGTVQTNATSGTLTFTPYIQGTALAQTAVMATQGTNAASPFQLEYTFQVRSAGTTGTAIAKPFGIIAFATPVYLGSTSSSTTTINTTSTATSTALYVTAQWATANASNSLLVETATVERVF